MSLKAIFLKLISQILMTSTLFLGDFLAKLHPTPAVCGLPKEAALSAIESFETISRGYYSGFCGPWNIHDESHLYVSLRCMQMYDERNFSLYAGGGLLKESRDKEEWEETEAKMNVMRRLLE